MTINDFFNCIENYYGKCENEYVFAMTENFVKKRFDEEKLPQLLSAVFRSHSHMAGYPGISEIEISLFKYEKATNKRIDKVETHGGSAPKLPELTEEEKAEVEESGMATDLMNKIKTVAKEKRVEPDDRDTEEQPEQSYSDSSLSF